jgi:hypothetical protein
VARDFLFRCTSTPELEAMIGTGLITRVTVTMLRYHATTSGKT